MADLQNSNKSMEYNTPPNMEDFLKYVKKIDLDIELSSFQKELAEILISYRVKHFGGGRGAGRTFVINAVQLYIHDVYSHCNDIGKEI